MGETCTIIKAEAIQHNDEIKRRMLEDGFVPMRSTGEIPFTKEISRKLYSPGRLNYPTEKANRLMSKYIWHVVSTKFPDTKIEAVIVHSKGNTIEDFREYLGPRDPEEYRLPENKHTLRAKYGLDVRDVFMTFIDGYECRFAFNGIHAPSSEEEFKSDKEIFF